VYDFNWVSALQGAGESSPCDLATATPSWGNCQVTARSTRSSAVPEPFVGCCEKEALACACPQLRCTIRFCICEFCVLQKFPGHQEGCAQWPCESNGTCASRREAGQSPSASLKNAHKYVRKWELKWLKRLHARVCHAGEETPVRSIVRVTIRYHDPLPFTTRSRASTPVRFDCWLVFRLQNRSLRYRTQ
jgi:hypothetical protein